MAVNLKAKKYDFVTAEEEIELVKDYQATKSEKSLTRLICSYMRLIDSMAFRRRSHKISDHDDLVQEGILGFIKGIQTFDLAQEVRLSTYLRYHISNAMYEFVIMNSGSFRFSMTKPNRKIFFNIRKYRNHDGKVLEKDVKIMASELDVPEHDIRTMDHHLSAQFFNIDGVDSNESGNYSVMDESSDIESVLQSKKLHDMESFGIMDALNEFDKRTADIIQQRYFTDAPVTMLELSKKYKVSAERVRQIEVKGIEFLRSKFNPTESRP